MRQPMWWMAMTVLAACGTDASPVEQCDDLVDVLCDRGVQCVGGSHSECVQSIQTGLACGSAKAVSGSYDRCIDQLQTGSCTTLFTTNSSTGELEIHLPADCMSVILTREAPPTQTSIEEPESGWADWRTTTP